MQQWRAAHHRRGDPYYDRLLERSRQAGRERTREARESREWRKRRVRNAIAALNAAGVCCQAIACRLGVNENSVYYWRTGKVTPFARNADRVITLARSVGVAA
jgi:hypothetical protein